jgi:APA family basic amino acid/polyamine antiporter
LDNEDCRNYFSPPHFLSIVDFISTTYIMRYQKDDEMSCKIGFWSVLALVTGSQIGSGVFMLPANLAPYGALSLGGWIISGLGAIALALVFAQLCCWLPKTGGPHVYVKEAFGPSIAFFTGWTYWVVSWISTTVVIIASIGYLTPLIGDHSPAVLLGLEIGLLLLITLLNFKGVKAAGNAEFLLTLLKIIPLFVMPLAALWFFDQKNIMVDITVSQLSTSQILGQVTLLTLWGFIGLESATTPAESVENPSKTIPRAVIWGTISVAVLYLLNSLGIMGVIPGSELMQSKAPYADAARVVFGGNWHIVISLIASVICIGTLNAWVLASSQVALGLAQDGLMPAFFSRKNRHDAPYWGLFISCAGIVPLLILTSNENLAKQMMTIIDFSVTAFLFVYAACCLAFFKLLLQRKDKASAWGLFYGCLALCFCGWIIYETPLSTLLIAGCFTLSGVPVYLWYCRQLKVC